MVCKQFDACDLSEMLNLRVERHFSYMDDGSGVLKQTSDDFGIREYRFRGHG